MKMENIADVLEMVEPRLQADESFSFLSLFPLVTVGLPPFVPPSMEDSFIQQIDVAFAQVQCSVSGPRTLTCLPFASWGC